MKGLTNWWYSDASDLLSHFGFSKRENKNGSHEIWSKGDIVLELYHRTNNKGYSRRGISTICKKAGIPLAIAKDWPNISKRDKKLIWDSHHP